MGWEARAVGCKLCEGSNCKFALHLVETTEIGVAWDAWGVYTALPEGRGSAARSLPRATGSLYTWSSWSGVAGHRGWARGCACARRCSMKSSTQRVGVVEIPCTGGQHMPPMSDTSQTLHTC